LFAAACSGPAGGKGTGQSAVEVVDAFFDDDLRQCTKDADCLTGFCDMTPVFTISTSGGYCMGFPNAFDRWQRVWLAERLAERARADEAVHDVLLKRLEEEKEYVLRPAEKEVVILLLAEVASQPAHERLKELYKQEEGGPKRLAGLKLAVAGFEEASGEVVEAALSSVVRVRMHAAAAAGGLCNAESFGVLKELASDSHYQVRQSAASALAACGGPEARATLEKLAEENRETYNSRPGDRFVFESALIRLSSRSPKSE